MAKTFQPNWPKNVGMQAILAKYQYFSMKATLNCPFPAV